MTPKQFTTELDNVPKPKVAVIPFLWAMIKGWILNNADDILILLLKYIRTTSKSPGIRELAGRLLGLLEPNKLMSDKGVTPPPPITDPEP